MSSLVSIRNVTKTYQRGPEKVQVLHGIDLDIPHGDFVALMGPSGSGKTTLLNLIGGLDTPSGGEIEIEGRPVALNSIHDAKAAGIGMVFQEFSLVPSLTVAQNMYLTVEPTGRTGLISDREARRLAAQVFSAQTRRGLTVSLLPLTDIRVLSSRGLQYPPDRLNIAQSSSRSISNIAIDDHIEITLESGRAALLIHEVDHGTS